MSYVVRSGLQELWVPLKYCAICNMLHPNDTNTNTRYVLYISRMYVIFDTNEQPTMHKGPNVVMVEMQGLDIFEARSLRPPPWWQQRRRKQRSQEQQRQRRPQRQ